ncbi:hypothetical protein MAH1_35200 [Sessilibacter sp. MAH1]
MDELGNYVCIEKNPESDVSVVIFSAVDCQEGDFHSVKALSHLSVNKIYVNCKENSWYLDGIPNLGFDWEQSAINLKKLAKSITNSGNGLVLYFGGSMGGAGALLYGLYANVDKIVSTGSEATFFRQGGYSSFKFKGHNVFQPDWGKLVSEFSGELLMIYGDVEPIDRIASDEFLNIHPKFRDGMYIISGYGHRVPVLISERMGFESFIKLCLKETLLSIDLSQLTLK